MRKLRDPIRRERVNQAGDKSGGRASCDLADEKIGAEPRQDERGEKQQVVRKDDVSGEGIHRKNLNRLPNQMLRIRERQRLRMKDVGVPESVQRTEIAGQESQNVIGVPRENPRVQSESPRSQGMSRVRPRDSGHVKMMATRRYRPVALTGVSGEG